MIVCYRFLIKQKRYILRFNTYKICWITGAMLPALLVDCPTRFRMLLAHITVGLQWIDLLISGGLSVVHFYVFLVWVSDKALRYFSFDEYLVHV